MTHDLLSLGLPQSDEPGQNYGWPVITGDQTLYRLTLESIDPFKVLNFERLLAGQFGRLRDVVEGPDGAIYLLTSNRDGRGSPTPDDDRVLRLTLR